MRGATEESSEQVRSLAPDLPIQSTIFDEIEVR